VAAQTRAGVKGGARWGGSGVAGAWKAHGQAITGATRTRAGRAAGEAGTGGVEAAAAARAQKGLRRGNCVEAGGEVVGGWRVSESGKPARRGPCNISTCKQARRVSWLEQ
jgi:hypothetical protein